MSFHDDDLFPFGSDAAEKKRHLEPFRKALADTGLVVSMVTTNLFWHPVFRDGGFTNNDRDTRRFAIAKVADNLDLAVELGAQVFLDGLDHLALSARPGAEGVVLVPWFEGERTPTARPPPSTCPGCACTPAPRPMWPGRPWRACCAAWPTAWTPSATRAWPWAGCC